MMRCPCQSVTVACIVIVLQAVIIPCSSTGEANRAYDTRISAMMSQRGLYGVDPPPLFPPVSSGNISQECQRDLLKLFNFTNTSISLKALDAFGKPGAGIEEINFAWLGNYDECMALEGFNYCLADMWFNSTVFKLKGLPNLMIRWGICPPASCSEGDLLSALKDLLDLLDEKWVSFDAVSAATVTCSKSPPIPYSVGVICTIVLLSILGVLMVVSSLYDEYLNLGPKKPNWGQRWLYFNVQSPDVNLEEEEEERDDDDEPLLGQDMLQHWRNPIIVKEAPPKRGCSWDLCSKFLLCFAATRNLSKLLDTQQKDTSIGALNGIRVISMTWVILGHSLEYSVFSFTMQNPLVLYEWQANDMAFQAIANGFFSVDTFFFLSGFLICYVTLSRMPEMNSVKAWGWFYFHRYWRLTPLLVFTMLVYIYIQPFFGDGPLWYTTTSKTNCEKYWWTSLLYIQNFYPQDFSSECIGWTWYLANDMQFFIISPLLLLPLYYAPVFGWIALSSLAILSMVATAVILIVYDISMDVTGIVNSLENPAGPDVESLVYDKPYCRIVPYLVGIGLGYIIHRMGKRKVRMSPLLAVIGWVVAAGIGLSVVYGLYPSVRPGHTMPRVAQVVYGSLCKLAWGLALAWVVCACKYGYGGWISKFLSWSGWIPLSRLTYAAYMFHPMVIQTFYGNFGTNVYQSKYLLPYYFAGNTLLTYFIALFVALAIEYPFVNLEKLFMPNNPKEKHEKYHLNRKLEDVQA